MTVAFPPGTTAWVLSDGKIGDEVQCFGVLSATDIATERRLVSPRAPWSWSPRMPVDPAQAPHRPGSPIAPPFPHIAIAAGRRTVPYLRALKRASHGRVFTIFIKDPYTGPGTADMLWVPAHDRLRAENIVVTLTPPHVLRPALFDEARRAPDARIAALPQPRVGMVLGGKGVNHDFSAADCAALIAMAVKFQSEGYAVMVTPSRRTPPHLCPAMAAALAKGGPSFVWDGTNGANPYISILAHADALLVTADSVNMVGEATATGVPVTVYEPSGGHAKVTAYLNRLVDEGAIRRYRGELEIFTPTRMDSAPTIAAFARQRYEAFLRDARPRYLLRAL